MADSLTELRTFRCPTSLAHKQRLRCTPVSGGHPHVANKNAAQSNDWRLRAVSLGRQARSASCEALRRILPELIGASQKSLTTRQKGARSLRRRGPCGWLLGTFRERTHVSVRRTTPSVASASASLRRRGAAPRLSASRGFPKTVSESRRSVAQQASHHR